MTVAQAAKILVTIALLLFENSFALFMPQQCADSLEKDMTGCFPVIGLKRSTEK